MATRREIVESVAREAGIQIGEVMPDLYGGGIWIPAMPEREPAYGNLHDSSCAGRRCLNPEHLGEGEAIDVRPIREETALVKVGRDDGEPMDCAFMPERTKHLGLICEAEKSSSMHAPHSAEDQARGMSPFCMTIACHPYTPPEAK